RSTNESLPFDRRPPEIVYFGGITKPRGIEEVVQALGLIPPELGARLVLAGQFEPPTLKTEIMSLEAAHRIDFLGWVNHDAIGRLLARARVGIVTYHPIPSHLHSQPTKLFDYMGAGL